MTEPVILRHCDACRQQTAHARDQRGEEGFVVTDHVCSKCGAVSTDQIKVHQHDE